MATITDIVNLALARIGNDAITNIEAKGDPSAQVANRIFGMIRDSVLREFPWNFAQRRGETLALLDGETTEEWAYAYAHPPQALHIWRVYSPGEQTGVSTWYAPPDSAIAAADYVIGQSSTNARIILSNAALAKCDYTIQVTNPAMFDPLFIDALAYRLAAEMAVALVAEETKRANCMRLYQEMISKAWTSQAGERKQELPRYSRYKAARL